MARIDEAYAAASALARYIEPVCEAAFAHRGTLENTADNQTAIDSLIKNRLAYRTDDAYGVQLAGVTMRLLHHVTKTYRLRMAAGSVADLLEHLKADCENYRRAQRSGSFDDQQSLEAEIYEQVFELIDLLHDLIQHFAFWVHNEFGAFSSIDIKIRKNQVALSKIDRLNTLFAECTITDLHEMAGNDPLLSRLLLKILKQTMDECRQELVSIAHRLREILARLQNDRENQRLNHLIDSFANHYQRHPGFKPDICTYADLPDALIRVEPLSLVAYPNLNSLRHQNLLGELACQVAENLGTSPLRREKEAFVPVEIGEQEAIPEPLDPIYGSVDFVFDALLMEDGLPELQASEAYGRLQLTIEYDIWLLLLVNRYEAQQTELRPRLRMELIEEPVPHYNGNHLVQDLRFVRTVQHG